MGRRRRRVGSLGGSSKSNISKNAAPNMASFICRCATNFVNFQRSGHKPPSYFIQMTGKEAVANLGDQVEGPGGGGGGGCFGTGSGGWSAERLEVNWRGLHQLLNDTLRFGAGH
ncbi:hypothetical protein GWI33_003196 [Rhynchophorus ferrugineus]|uniref:Uncharacterized protein n=1 Tax=Rhynchophorus ferrugineus TaxID=354439 RepID=A0A834IZ52_RHYFE|nr:hypothetical protein GWI33_003196 [Rhynchophorus ferrugineus]